MKFYFKLFTVLVGFVALSRGWACDLELEEKFNALPATDRGISSATPGLDDLMRLFPGPSLSSTGKSFLTVNRMGFDVLNHPQFKNWLLEDYEHFIDNKNLMVLDIGCGYGNLSLEPLEKGCTVIANDIAPEHLIQVRRKAHEKGLDLENLYLNNRSFPDQTSFKNNSLDAVVLHRVLTFLSPEQIQEGVEKIKEWLKPGGKIFIVTMAPQNKSFSEWFLPLYEEKWANGDKWPGVNMSVARGLPDQAYNLPEYLHIMDERPLRLVLEQQGFKIEKANFINMKQFGKPEDNRDGREAIGMIAIKQ